MIHSLELLRRIRSEQEDAHFPSQHQTAARDQAIASGHALGAGGSEKASPSFLEDLVQFESAGRILTFEPDIVDGKLLFVSDNADLSQKGGSVVYYATDLLAVRTLTHDQLRAVHSALLPLPIPQVKPELDDDELSWEDLVGGDLESGDPAGDHFASGSREELNVSSLFPDVVNEPFWASPRELIAWDAAVTEKDLGLASFPLPEYKRYERVADHARRAEAHRLGLQAYAAAATRLAEMTMGMLRRLRNRLLTDYPRPEVQVLKPTPFPCLSALSLQVRYAPGAPIVTVDAWMQKGEEESICRGGGLFGSFQGPPFPRISYGCRTVTVHVSGQNNHRTFAIPVGTDADEAVTEALLEIVTNQVRRVARPPRSVR